MASTIQLRVDDELKIKSDELFTDLGTDTTTNSPFEALVEKELLDKLSKSREHAEQGLFQAPSAVSVEMRTKYGI